MNNSGLLKILSRFLDLFYPAQCIFCGNFSDCYVCSLCLDQIIILENNACSLCGRLNKFSQFCPDCRQNAKVKLDGLIVCTKYDDTKIKELIYKLKYQGLSILAKPIAQIYYKKLALSNIDLNSYLFIPVPLHPKRSRRRGFNQSELICRELGKIAGIKSKDILQRTTDTPSQTQFKKRQREINVKNAFRVKSKETIRGRAVFLVDDISTTGSTLNECAKVLKKKGAKEVYGIVLAKNIK